MVYSQKMRRLLIPGCLIVLICLTLYSPAYSAFLYKSYTVKHDRGWDILCDPYTVRKGDWVLKLFEQRGEISQNDFPEFLSIFKRINPHIHDINRIRPGQQILIPLKKLDPNSLYGQSSGTVTFPFVAISSIHDTFKTYLMEYEVQKGDTVWSLVGQRFCLRSAGSYEELIRLFLFVNPEIVDPDRIYTGQKLYIIDPSIQREPWYRSLFDSSGNIVDFEHVAPEQASVPVEREAVPKSPMLEAAAALDAKLLNKGIYHFPRERGKDFRLDLSLFPVMELKCGMRIILYGKERIQLADLKVIRASWNNIKVVPITEVEKNFFKLPAARCRELPGKEVYRFSD